MVVAMPLILLRLQAHLIDLLVYVFDDIREESKYLFRTAILIHRCLIDHAGNFTDCSPAGYFSGVVSSYSVSHDINVPPGDNKAGIFIILPHDPLVAFKSNLHHTLSAFLLNQAFGTLHHADEESICSIHLWKEQKLFFLFETKDSLRRKASTTSSFSSGFIVQVL